VGVELRFCGGRPLDLHSLFLFILFSLFSEVVVYRYSFSQSVEFRPIIALLSDIKSNFTFKQIKTLVSRPTGAYPHVRECCEVIVLVLYIFHFS
jgi:hypothetical protein